MRGFSPMIAGRSDDPLLLCYAFCGEINREYVRETRQTEEGPRKLGRAASRSRDLLRHWCASGGGVPLRSITYFREVLVGSSVDSFCHMHCSYLWNCHRPIQTALATPLVLALCRCIAGYPLRGADFILPIMV